MVYPRKSTVKHNYAQANLRGFNSTRSLRSKRLVNRITSSAPSSPSKTVNAKKAKVTKSNKSNMRKEFELNKVAKKLLGLKDSELILCNGANAFVASPFKGSTINNSPRVNVTPKHDKHVRIIDENAQGIHTPGDNGKRGIYDDVNADSLITESIDTTMASREERKKLAMAEIAQMEAELQELEEDEELLQLQKRQAELKQKLDRKRAQATPKQAKRSSKSKKLKKNEYEPVPIMNVDMESELEAVVGKRHTGVFTVTSRHPKCIKHFRKVGRNA